MTDLIITRQEHLVEFCFNRPDKHNSLTPEMLFEMAATLEELGRSPETLIVVVRGTGDQFFSSGYDISRIPPAGSPEAKVFATNKPLDVAIKALEAFPFPTIAMLNGSAYGGGCELAFSCDFRYAADHIRMCMPPAKIGLIYSVEGLERFKNIIGLANAKRMFLTADAIEADQLNRFGALDFVTSKERLEEGVRELVQRMGQLAPLSLKGHKAILNQLTRHRLPAELLEQANEWIEESYASEDAKEGKAAFMEKRVPQFRGC